MSLHPVQMPCIHHVYTPGGTLPVFIPNSVVDGDGFYVSHNNHDHAIYGGETTALVLGQMEKFYVLKGDHRQAYAAHIKQGFQACLNHFKQHPELVHPYSDKLPATPEAEADQDEVDRPSV